MIISTKARDGKLYEAHAEYCNGVVIIKKGSKINRRNALKFVPPPRIAELRENDLLFYDSCYLKNDLSLPSLSFAATFVTGRIANGNIVWKTKDGKSLKYLFAKKGKK